MRQRNHKYMMSRRKYESNITLHMVLIYYTYTTEYIGMTGRDLRFLLRSKIRM